MPAGRCSSALMLRCTLASRGSSRSLHASSFRRPVSNPVTLAHILQIIISISMILLRSIAVRKLQVAILARSFPEMSQAVHID